MAKDLPAGVHVEVSPDRMEVMLHVKPEVNVSAAEIITCLRGMKIININEASIADALRDRNDQDISLQVAAGIPPVGGKPERIKYLVSMADGISRLTTKVEQGQVIATITPGVAGMGGADVFGQPLEHLKSESPKISRGLMLGNGKVTSEVRGSLRLHDNTLSVEPLLELFSDDRSMAPITFDGDAVIRGCLNEGRTIHITGSLTVGGVVEAVQLKAGGCLFVQGGITGKQKGKYVIGGSLRCRFVTGGFIVCGNDMNVQTDIIESRIACAGRLEAPVGAIWGGTIAANQGLSCYSLGHAGSIPTLVEAGEGIASRVYLALIHLQIASNKNRIAKVRAKVAPLLKGIKSLTAAQREKVTELLYDADQLEEATKQLIVDVSNQTKSLAAHARSQVSVEHAVHAGVTIRFPTLKTTFISTVKGPLSIEVQKSEGVPHIVLIDKRSEPRVVLPSQSPDASSEPMTAEPPEAHAA